MEITKTIKAGNAGSKNLQGIYGDSLICVRYRIDAKKKRRYTTVEIIVNEKNIINYNVWVQLDIHSLQLRLKLMEEGAKWNTKKRLWKMSIRTAKLNDLENRIVDN